MRTHCAIVAAIWMAGITGLFGCLKPIGQASNSGRDARRKGATSIELEVWGDKGKRKAEGLVRDVVTYPGGDRVDWKSFEIPEGIGGTIKVKLKARTPRPKMDVTFNLYDQHFNRIARAKRRPGRSKSKIFRTAPGIYYVQVYAPKRQDAGRYTLSIRYREGSGGIAVDTGPTVPDPPTLPAIPDAPPPECTQSSDCQGGGSCAANKCIPAVGTTPEPSGAPACGPDEDTIDGTCVPKKRCLAARVVKYQLSGGKLVVTVDRGEAAGVKAGWTGQVLVKKSTTPLGGGSFKITKSSRSESSGRTRLSVDQVKANRSVSLCPN